MSRDVVTVSPEDSCRWALQVMSAAEIHHLPVLEGARLIGLITETDILKRRPERTCTRIAAEDQSGLDLLSEVRVGALMTYGPTTISPDASLTEAARTMIRNEVGSLPVVSGKRLVGIITAREILAAFVTNGGEAK